MKEKKLIPKRRFVEFKNNNAWQQRKLSDVTIKVGSGKTPRGGSSVYVRFGIPLLRSQNIKNNRVNFDEVVYITESMNETMSNSLVMVNDVLLNITGASIGRSAVYNLAERANVNQHVCIIRPNQEINSNFIQLNLTSEKGQKQIEINQAGGAREGLNFQQIAKMNFAYPNYKEQQKIGNFFKHLDQMITLEQRKLEKTKALKSAYLAEMFPAEGERVPKRRFVGFMEEWERVSIEDLMDVTSVKRIHQTDWTSEGVPFLRARDIVSYNKKELPKDRLYITKEIYEEYSRISGKVEKGDLLVTGVGTIGIPFLIKDDNPIYFKDGNIIWFRNRNKISEFFFYYSFINKYTQNYIKNVAGIGTVGTFTIESGRRLSVNLPKYKEQQLIGDFFKKLDDQITNQQQKLEKLKAMKQAYLQEMFV